MLNTNYFHRFRIRILWILVSFFAVFGSAAAQLADGVGAQPEAKVSAKRYDISSMLMLLNDDSSSTTPLPNTPPVMENIPSQNGSVGVALTPINLASFVTATNGDLITGYAMASGRLPPGVSLNARTGSIGGTPTTVGAYTVTVTASDKDGTSNSSTIVFAISGAVAATPPVMGRIPEQEGTLNTPIAKISLANYVTRTNGDSVTAYSIASGDLPPGLTFDSSSGVISGTPSAGGSYNVNVTASDKDGASNTAVVWFEILDPALQIAPDMRGLPESMTYDERMAAIDKVSAYIKNFWASQNLGSDKTTLVEYIASQPEFADAGISPDGSVWARFKDGRPASFPFTDSSTSPLINAIVSPLVAPSPSIRALASAAYASQPLGVMPSSKTAMLLNIDNLGRTFPDTVAPWLTKAGYEVVRPVGTIVDLMDKVKDVGVLHIATHGTYIVRTSGVREYVLGSADHVIARNQLDTARQQFLDKMLQGGYIFVSAQTSKDSLIQTKYWSFGEKLVHDYWSFSANSLIVVDACKMYEDPGSSASFRNALAGISKNQTVLLGWNAEATAAGAAETMTLFFDLLLARNETQPISQPPARPQSLANAYYGMDSLGKLVDPYDNKRTTKLIGEAFGVEAAYNGLLPNIQFANVFPPKYGAVNASDQWVLHLHGAFGTTAGLVTLNDQPLSLQKPWDPENLYAILSTGPTGSYGSIVVDVAGHKSNAVPLTQWNGTVAQSFIDNSIGAGASIEIVCPVRGIGDTHFGRTDIFTGPSFLVTDVRLEAMAACTYNMSGTWNSSDGKYEYRFSGSGSVDTLETSSTGKTKMGYVNSKGLENKLSYSLPAELPGEMTASLTLTGSLKTFEVKTGALISTESKTSKWQKGDQQEYFVKLGTDYSLYKSRSCTNKYTGLTKCTEVWDLKPNTFSVPTAQTQG